MLWTTTRTVTKIRRIVACSVLALSVNGQRFSFSLHFPEKVPVATFDSCGGAEESAKELSKAIPDPVYVMELFPSDQYTQFFPFLTDRGGYLQQALSWLTSYRNQALPPRALIYVVNGGYAFRCRDNHEHFAEAYGPGGDPLQLKTAAGKAEIWHFSITPEGLAHVFIVTDRALGDVDGEDLMAQVKQKLGTHFTFLYVRNDPWFLGSSSDAAPYIFAADRFKFITEEDYRNSKTMLCRTDIGCKVSPNME